ncbi:hypothetical protein GCM10027299_46770 [Larkinella ripae]
MKPFHVPFRTFFLGGLTGLLLACEKPDTEKPCFAHESLETTPWLRAHLAGFQQPTTGPLRVVVYAYEGHYYLAFENPRLSAPMANVFNCAGQRLPELKIEYDRFMKRAKDRDVLLEETY